jgi:CheY-like chemotaxis protein
MKKRPVKSVLLAEHNREDAQMIKDMFKDQGSYAFELTHGDCIEGTEKYLAEHPVDVVLLSLELLDAPGLEAIRRVMKVAANVATVVQTTSWVPLRRCIPGAGLKSGAGAGSRHHAPVHSRKPRRRRSDARESGI